MLSFKDLEIGDREIITSYTLKSPNLNCDLSFANLCSWRFLYNTKFATHNGFLFLKFWTEGQLAYMFPIGEGDTEAAVREIMEDAGQEKAPLFLSGLTKEECNFLENMMPGKFKFETNRDYSDYIYLREKLATLSGKKLQSKRNHTNKFKKTYNYEFKPIDSSNIAECMQQEREWCQRHDCTKHEGTGYERRSIVYALEHFDELHLMGGMLYVDGKCIAFTFGTAINENTFGVHVEKADTDVDGAYAMINCEFANYIPEKYTYMNREEDLGIPGLRKAKLSYKPAILLDKFTASLADEATTPYKWE